MGHTGENPEKQIIVIIPARLDSTRLPGKLLLPLAGKPLILWTLEQAKKAKNISRIVVAADDEKILNAVLENGDEAILTDKNHQSGSDRVAEVARQMPGNSIIVNVQGDEPLISPRAIENAVEAILKDERADVATTCELISDFRDVLSSDVVKVVTDKDNFAVYFSRSPIPYPRDAAKKQNSLEDALRNEPELLAHFRKHTGLYVYRREYLLKFTTMPQSNLEKIESLEQLRILENNGKIKVVETETNSVGVDTAEDFERVRRILEQ